MLQLSPSSFTYCTIIFFLFASIMGVTGLLRRTRLCLNIAGFFSLLAFFCQTLVLIFGFHRLFPDDALTIGAYLQMIAWFALLCGIGAWWRLKHITILLFATPFAFILFLMSVPSLSIPLFLPPTLDSAFYVLHIGALFLSLGFLGLAFTCSLMFLIFQKNLKAKKQTSKLLNKLWHDFPALTTLDKINYGCTLCIFPLYTIGLVAGLFWAIPSLGVKITYDPKEITSLVIWLLLGWLFYKSLNKDWRGRKPAWIIVIVFLLSIISIFVVNFFLPTHHGLFRG